MLNGICYLSKGLQEESCSENIFEFLNEKRPKWIIGIRCNGVDVYAKYKVMMGEAIPKLVGGDKILEQSVKATVTRKVRSKYSADSVR